MKMTVPQKPKKKLYTQIVLRQKKKQQQKNDEKFIPNIF